ncbi:16S rRNA (adenine(1518)-N(6)/adenine(1519)-N(6))-dimethyltransferase RsmA [Saxibacter everestensis]|uniref:Ribosomal RNA small subunit methyltransferase A n=1 Tax=Saxibacter everestensis TaxID=2909229 RepID=A0ABY8QX28_9MICO|nr:16S rRNA (adenine(1518)-N(6)/adenine(1519)-N(6))-dimethyltransferase RsmA [Brevibacteriaceae bacterium ZFBP1038]
MTDSVQSGGATDDSRLLGAADIRRLAERLDIRPTKQLGQNFVIDPNTVRRIVRTARVQPGEHIVEIGPGLGSLTLGLLEAGATVTAVEIDPKLAGELAKTVHGYQPEADGRFRVVNQDALRLQELPGEAGPPVALVANLPYNISVPVLLHFLELFPQLERVLVMVQAEVADRLAAAPGSRIYGVPSVKAAWYADVKRVGAVGRHVFWPAPKVDSGLVSFTCRTAPITSASRLEVFAAIDAAFAQRRKTLRSALSSWAGSAQLAEDCLREAGIDHRLRGEAIDVHDFARIAEAKQRVAAAPQ